MIKTAEKHQTLSIFKQLKEHHRFQTNDIDTHTKKLQPYGTESDHNRIMWAPPQNCTYSSIQVPTRERKHNRNRLVLVTHDTTVRSLESAGPIKTPQKNTKVIEARSYETHCTKPQEPRPADKEERYGASALQCEWKTPFQRTDLYFQTLGRRLLEPAVGIRAVLSVPKPWFS
jgi:hypothetical protein